MVSLSAINLYCQKFKLSPPSFTCLEKNGEDHHPIFRVNCTFEGEIEEGEGKSLKLAKENAAKKIVEKIGIEEKLKEVKKDKVVYSIESYNVPLKNIWDGDFSEYTLTLRRKEDKISTIKNFKVKIIREN